MSFVPLWLDDDRIRWPTRIVTNNDLFAGSVIVGMLLLLHAECLGGFVLNASEHVSVGYFGDPALVIRDYVDDSPVSHAARF